MQDSTPSIPLFAISGPEALPVNPTGKLCPKCDITKPVSQFSRNVTRADGLQGWCKRCFAVQPRSEVTKEKGRIRNAERIAERREYRNDSWRKRNPEKCAAHYAVVKALESGDLVKEPCIECGNPRVEGHHADYSKPLEVTWLCTPCHNRRHVEVRYMDHVTVQKMIDASIHDHERALHATELSPISGKAGVLNDAETSKHRHLVKQYCYDANGHPLNGCDLGSSGVPVVPHAIQVDLPPADYHEYNRDRPEAVIHWRGSATDLPFRDGVLDFVHASHLAEDFVEWNLLADPFFEWDRVLKPGGHLIVAVPDHERFRAYVKRGADVGIDQDNKSHKHESFVGELTALLGGAYEVIMDRFALEGDTDYSIVFVGRKL